MLRGVAGADPAAAPVVGDGCWSFFPAEDALAEALGAWPGELRAEVDRARRAGHLDRGVRARRAGQGGAPRAAPPQRALPNRGLVGTE